MPFDARARATARPWIEKPMIKAASLPRWPVIVESLSDLRALDELFGEYDLVVPYPEGCATSPAVVPVRQYQRVPAVRPAWPVLEVERVVQTFPNLGVPRFTLSGGKHLDPGIGIR